MLTQDPINPQENPPGYMKTRTPITALEKKARSHTEPDLFLMVLVKCNRIKMKCTEKNETEQTNPLSLPLETVQDFLLHTIVKYGQAKTRTPMHCKNRDTAALQKQGHHCTGEAHPKKGRGDLELVESLQERDALLVVLAHKRKKKALATIQRHGAVRPRRGLPSTRNIESQSVGGNSKCGCTSRRTSATSTTLKIEQTTSLEIADHQRRHQHT